MLYNKHLSWPGFNQLVLLKDEKTYIPLYECMRLLAIYLSNLHKFFKLRYTAIVALTKLNKKKINKEMMHINIKKNVDRFLEQIRLFIFRSHDEVLVVIRPSHLIRRNFRHRIKVIVPVKVASCNKELLNNFKILRNDHT